MDLPSLVERCQLGDKDAFGALYEAHSVKALRTAYLITGQRETAEDAVQEAFIQCFIQIGTLREPRAFTSWFYRTLTRVSWRYCQKDRPVRNCVEYSDQAPELYALSDAQLLQSETRQEVYEAIRGLSPALKVTVVLHYFNGFSVNEISSIMGCFAGTVKFRLFRARQQLKKELSYCIRDDSADAMERECAYSAGKRI